MSRENGRLCTGVPGAVKKSEIEQGRVVQEQVQQQLQKSMEQTQQRSDQMEQATR